MGTMSNTLILAFTGGSINLYSVGIELMQGLSSSMGVVLAVPLTSLIGAWLIGRKKNTEIDR